MAAPPPELVDDVTAEILLRLPPDEPEHLFRAALVCKPWLCVVSDPDFLRRYRAFHGAPPLLGLLHQLQVLQGDPAPRFAPTTALPAFPHPGADGRRTRPLDCRHGRVLIHMLEDESMDYLVWDPVTGDRHGLPEPGIDWLIYSAAVLCATDGCDHLDCHGGPFRVVFVATDEHEDVVKASVYSSETGAWSPPVSLDASSESYVQHKQDAVAKGYLGVYYTPYVMPRRGALIEDEMYCTLRWGNAIVKYNWANNSLSMIDPPSPNANNRHLALMLMEDSSLGFAFIQDYILHLWSRKVNSGVAEWEQCRVIGLEGMIPGGNAFVAGFAEGVDVIFVSTGVGLFTFELKSGRVRKVDDPGVYFSVLPYMSFYTPDRATLSSLASTG